MKKDLQVDLSESINELETAGNKGIILGTVLVGVNLVLMLFVGFYWTNPEMHQYISGQPLL